MKTNVEFPKKVKNSLIYFQIGLIVTLLTVLFVLELNFESTSKKAAIPETVKTFEISEPAAYRIISESQPIAASKLVKAQPKFVNQFQATTSKVPEEIIKPIETAPSTDLTDNAAAKPSQVVTPQSVIGTTATATASPYNVEELPIFPACKGLSRAEQLKCFEEQMRKKVAENLDYPDSDYQNGKQGRTFISFVIDEKGKIVEVKAENNKNATPEMQKAAENAVRSVSKLTPAKQGGAPVRVKYTIPVTFRMSN